MTHCWIGSLLAAGIFLAVASAAWADETDILNQTKPKDVSGKIEKVVDGYSELCDAIRQQMIARMKAQKDFCPIPMVDPKAHVRRPNWQPVDVESAADLLGEAVPRLRWSVKNAYDALRRADPSLTREAFNAAFWAHYREPILAALGRRPDFFEKAMIDVDNNGTKEEVFRIASLEPVDPDDPTGPWTMRPCNSDYPDGFPFYGIFVAPEKRRELGTLADVGQAHDLFFYRARTFLTTASNLFSIQIDWNRFLNDPNGTGKTEGFFSQACYITLRKTK